MKERVRFMLVAGVLVATGQPLAVHASAGSNQKTDHLLVYGQGFMFSVKEPAGWTADTQNAARLEANVAFYPRGQAPEGAAALIRVRVNGKVDDNTKADLQADMEGYQRAYPGVKFEDVPVSHRGYRTFSKLFFAEGAFFEYVAYVNPGKGVPFVLSVSMNKQKGRATPAELQAFQEVVRTLQFFNGVQVSTGVKARGTAP